MNKKYLFIVGVILIVLGFFGYKNYQSIEKQNAKYKEQYIKDKRKSELEKKSKENNKQVSNNEIKESKSQFTGEKIFTYSSSYYDIEKTNGQVITKNELTYHIFNFNKKTVTQISNVNGEYIKMTYPFYSMYEENGIVATTYVLKVHTLGVKEIWWSPDVPNLGYDYDDGKRIACYGLKIKAK